MMIYLEYAIYLIAAILRLANLGTAALWYDESFTYMITSRDFPSMLAAIVGDVHPPLYYLITAPFTQLAGLNEFWIRLPSAALSMVGLYLTGKVARQLGLSERARLVGMALLALLPSEIYYAQEARMYALFQALVLAWLLMVLRRRWSLAALFGILTMYTHNYALFYLPVIGLIALAGEIKRPVILANEVTNFPWLACWKPGDQAQVRGALLSALIPAICWLPWQFILLPQMTNVYHGYWIGAVTVGSVLNALYLIFFSFYPPQTASLISVIVLYSLLLYAAIRTRRQVGNAWPVLILLGFGPLLLSIAGSLAWKPVLLFRGLMPSVPLLCLLIAAALTTGPGWKLLYSSALITPLLVGGLVNYYAKVPADKGLIYQDVARMREYWQPGDLLIHSNSSSLLRWQAYAPDIDQTVLPGCGPNGGELSEKTRTEFGAYIDQPNDQTQRIWFLWEDGPTSPQCEIQRAEDLTRSRSARIILANNKYNEAGIFLLDELQ